MYEMGHTPMPKGDSSSMGFPYLASENCTVRMGYDFNINSLEYDTVGGCPCPSQKSGKSDPEDSPSVSTKYVSLVLFLGHSALR